MSLLNKSRLKKTWSKNWFVWKVKLRKVKGTVWPLDRHETKFSVSFKIVKRN